MRVLVTGSEGSLGKPLVGELRRRGHEVFGCDLFHSADMRADVGEYRQIERVFDHFKPEAVFHLAGEFGRHNGNRHYEQVWKTNLIGTHHVCELCSHHDARLLFASSSEIYGTCDAEILTEDLPERVPLHQPNEYALSKWANEVQIQNFARNHDLDAVRFRFFNVYGPGEYFHPFRSVVALFCHHLSHGEPIDVFRGYHRTFMFAADFIPTLANGLQGRSGEVYNIGGTDYRSIEDLAEIVLEATGADRSLINYHDDDPHNIRSKRPDNTRAQRDLGHDPRVLLEEGVPLTLEWMKGTR